MKQEYKAKYLDLLGYFERLGGNIQGVPSFYSLENEAKVRKEIQKLEKNKSFTSSTKQKEEILPQNEPEKPQNDTFTDFIANYPPVLHPVFLRKKENWLKACSLKIQLNQTAPNKEEEALLLQHKIWLLFEQMDSDDAILMHWKKHKRILEEEKEDFSTLSPTELVQKRNTLRSNIVSREKTLQKWKEKAEKKEVSFTFKEKILKKTEELEKIKLQIKQLNELIR